jgi:hypothetical protein
MLQPNVLSHGLRLRHVRRLGSCAQMALVLAALYGGQAAAESSPVIAVAIEPHAVTGGIEAAPAVAQAVRAEARSIEDRSTQDERQRHMLMMLMIVKAAQRPSLGRIGR